MKKLLILGNFLFFSLALCAQNNYFIFIQSENNQPYYVQTDGKTLSSSPVGHLIVSGLKDSAYTLNIGFPKNQFSEQLFQVRINRKDAGYQLKNLGPEGWALVSMQSLQLIKAQQVNSKKQTIAYGDLKKTDNFSMLMAGLVNDSAVLYTSIAKAEPPKESSKTSIPDTPLTTNVVKQDQDSKTDTAVIKTELASQTELSKKDTSLNKGDFVKVDEVQPKDSIITKTETVTLQEPLKKDSLLVKNEPAKSREQQKDTLVTTADTKQAEIIRKDSGVLVKQLPAAIDRQQATDAPSKLQPLPAETRPSALKPLIVWFSETKTSKGTELVFFDMSAADKTDTIKILVPLDSAIPKNADDKEVKIDSNEDKKENQKTGAGKLIGKIFGKKSGTQPSGEDTDSTVSTVAEEKKSTIKVTTVERKPADPTVVKNKNQAKAGTDEVTKSKIAQKDTVEKSNSGNFFAKLFGKRNSQEPSPAGKPSSTPNASATKVTTVEDSRSADSGTANNKKKRDESNAEVERLRKAQEEEEKTSTERFFGKIFGKKKKEISKDSISRDESKGNQVSFKVTDVGTPTRSDTGRSAANEKKAVLLNSDCSDFATDSDIDKLKIKILSRKDIDAQIAEAKKFFKAKCLSTKQVKALSTLYKTDADKYKLFDASYPFVSDSNNFMDLVVLLTEPYYINRFIAMVRM